MFRRWARADTRAVASSGRYRFEVPGRQVPRPKSLRDLPDSGTWVLFLQPFQRAADVLDHAVLDGQFDQAARPWKPRRRTSINSSAKPASSCVTFSRLPGVMRAFVILYSIHYFTFSVKTSFWATAKKLRMTKSE